MTVPVRKVFSPFIPPPVAFTGNLSTGKAHPALPRTKKHMPAWLIIGVGNNPDAAMAKFTI